MDIESESSIFCTPKGATPIEPDDLQFLIPRLRTRAQLNEFEERNIFDAKENAHTSRYMRRNLISNDGLTKLHLWMFNEVWTWAGQFRTRITNIGVEVHQIRSQLATLLGSVQYWIENNTYTLEECAVRFHHKLVQIHLFPNGNGRHARLVADLMMFYDGQPEFTWGGKSIDVESEARNRYLAALKKADGNNYTDLMKFASAE